MRCTRCLVQYGAALALVNARGGGGGGGGEEATPLHAVQAARCFGRSEIVEYLEAYLVRLSVPPGC